MDPVVETPHGRVRGLEQDGIRIFRGIPYAAPPVGPLRFAAPRPPEPWAGVRDATAFGPSAPQASMRLPLPGMDVGPMDEDCLYLNVYTPGTSGKRPVMVWIHGGGFVIGSGSQPIYDGTALARRGDVVVVTLNYRLGPLGFLDLEELCPELEGAVANAGLRDQIAALEWVRDAIEAFGGDPDCVTVFGESAGGMSVASLLAMPAAGGLFRRAIPQSGAGHNVHTRESARLVAEHLLGRLGLSPREAAVALREIPPDKLVEGQQQTILDLGSRVGLLPFQPVVDGDSLPQRPVDAVAAGVAEGVDLLTGTNRDEWKLFALLDPGLATLDEPGLVARVGTQIGSTERARELVRVYREAREGHRPTDPRELFFAIETDRVFRIPAIRLAEAQSHRHPGTFMYLFTWESPAMGGALGSCHALEVPFVFGAVGAPGADLFVGTGPEAHALEARMMDAWTSFARSGDPSHPELPGGRWPAYDEARRPTMILGPECAVELDPGERERRAFEGIL